MVIAGFRSGRRRRQPYPFDIKLGGVGMMLLDDGTGPSFRTKQLAPLEKVQPTEYGYSSVNPEIESTIVYDDLADGLGLSNQEDPRDRRYHYSLGNDHAVAKENIKGPEITKIDPVQTSIDVLNGGSNPLNRTKFSTDRVQKIFEHEGSLYVIIGARILRRTGDSATDWTEVKNFNPYPAGTAEEANISDWYSGVNIHCAETFHSNYEAVAGDGGTNYIFVGTYVFSDGLSRVAQTDPIYYSSDGTTWTQFTKDSSNDTYTEDDPPVLISYGVYVGTFGAQAFKVIGKELYRAHDVNMLAKLDTDANPIDAGNWSNDNAFRIGNKDSNIVSLDVNAEGALMIFKTDGIYTLDKAGKDHKLFPHLQFAPGDNAVRLNTTNPGTGAVLETWKVEALPQATNIGHYLNDLYIGYGEAYYRISPDNSLEEVGPERFITGSAGIKGKITAFQGHGSFHAYAGLYDEDNNKSYLLKYGAWRGPERLRAWHGSITAAFTPSPSSLTAEITALFKSSIGAPSGHTRLYIGFADGQIAWFTLPCVADPSDCSEYRFTTADTETILPRFTGHFSADNKIMRAISITGDNLDGLNYASVAYRIDSIGAYQNFNSSDGGNQHQFKDAPRERKDFPTVTVGTFFDPKLILTNEVNTSSPKVRGIALHYNVRSTQIFNYDFSILAEDGLIRLDNVPLRIGADRIRFHLKTSARAFSSVQIITPEETTETINIKDYQEEQFWDEKLKQYRAIVNISATTESTAYGSYTQVNKYTFGELGGHTFGELKLL